MADSTAGSKTLRPGPDDFGLGTLFDLRSGGIAVVDRGCRIVFVNTLVQTICGYTAEELDGASVTVDRRNRSTRANPRRRSTLLPVVVLASPDGKRDSVANHDWHADSYVRKSVDFAVFNRSVQQIGRCWLAFSITPGR
jgi:PAS domain-containing protein